MIYSFLLEQTNDGETVLLYSDGCTYQNRNSTLSTALSNLATEKNVRIVHKYLEPGHTQMEVDSVHSTIEQNVKNRKINLPADYVALIEGAKVRKPLYQVRYLNFDFFKNFQAISTMNSIRPPKNGTSWPIVTDIRALKYEPNGEIFYSLQHGTEFQPLNPPNTGNRSCRKKAIERNFTEFNSLPNLYKAAVPIDKTKYIHLQHLKESLPKDFHSFYDNLPFIVKEKKKKN